MQSRVLFVTHIAQNEIRQPLLNAKYSFTAGVDGIPSFILHDCAPAFITPLDRLFNLVLKPSYLPGIWKRAYVCPVFKKGDVSKIQNYRKTSCVIFLKFLSMSYLRTYVKVLNLLYQFINMDLEINYY